MTEPTTPALTRLPVVPLVLTVLVALGTPGELSADKRLRLVRADVLENITVDGQAIQILQGNVVFAKENMILSGERARYNQHTGQGSLIAKVRMTKEDLTLTCDSLHFDSPRDVLHGFGHTHIWDQTYDLVADTLAYFTELDSASAQSRVRLTQKNQIITARRIVYTTAEEGGVSYTASGAVKIREEERVATSGQAIYHRDREITRLRINPQVREKDRILSGQEIELQYREEELERIFIPARARSVFQTSGWQEQPETAGDSIRLRRIPVEFNNDMTGAVLKGFFQNGVLDSLRLEGMATTLYHIFEDSIYQGNNQASGDTISMLIREGDLQRIFIAGGSRGIFTPDSSNAGIEGPITYTSRDIDYRIDSEETDLHGEARIDYTNLDLKAGFINVNWRKNLLKALPATALDSSYGAIQPIITERGREPMVGDSMLYNLQSRRGRISRGKTKAEDGYYSGREIRNREEKLFYIRNSTYTTCDLEVPHFHFNSRRLKMIADDKVIARPIVLHIGGVPLLGLPFGLFPHQKGTRHSGWIMPGYGESSQRGQYLDGLGYYWAPNNHWDSKFTLSLADRQGVTLRLNNTYKSRYRFSGGVYLENRYSFPAGLRKSERNIAALGRVRKTDYVVRWNHNQVLRRDQSLRVNASYYSSGEYNYVTEIDPVKRLNQQTVSNATYSKRWKKSDHSISVNLSDTRDLMAEKKIDPGSPFYRPPTRTGTQLNITRSTLPGINFRHGQRHLIPTAAVKKKWFHQISYSYSSNFTNKLRTYYETGIDPLDSSLVWNREEDGSARVNTLLDYALVHNLSFSAPWKIFRYITLNPSLRLQSDWVNKTYRGRLVEGVIQKEEIPGFAARTTGAFSLSLNTKLYGLFPLRIGSLHSLRHTMSPALSYSYKPDFSQPFLGRELGYFQSLSGQEPFDRFAGTMAGGTPRNKSQSLSFSLNNILQAKLLEGEEERKLDLFSWRLSSGYNFVAEEFNLSQLRSSIRTNIARVLNLDLSMTHDFYQYDRDQGKRVNTLRKSDSGLLAPRLINARLSTGFRISGRSLQDLPPGEATRSDTSSEGLDDPLAGKGFTEKAQSLEGGQVWSTSLSFSYLFNQANPANPTQTFWMNTNSRLQVTKHWRIQYSARFDLMERSLVSHHFSIYRDLHCWELSLNWTPSGYGNGFYLRINVKSPNLRDLKFEERGGIFRRQPKW